MFNNLNAEMARKKVSIKALAGATGINFSVGGKGYNWDRIPLIPFKYNDEEQPLIVNCKSLQDALNQILSTFDDAMNEDVRNTIDLLYFVDLHLLNCGVGDFSNIEATITFNTDMPMDEASTISNAKNSVGLISNRTIVAHHPWVTNPDMEMQQMDEEKQESVEQAMSAYDPFGNQALNQSEEGQGGEVDE